MAGAESQEVLVQFVSVYGVGQIKIDFSFGISGLLGKVFVVMVCGKEGHTIRR
jgi:hypothetical protein